MNRELQPDLETILMMPPPDHILTCVPAGAGDRSIGWLSQRIWCRLGRPKTKRRSWILRSNWPMPETRSRGNEDDPSYGSTLALKPRTINHIEPFRHNGGRGRGRQVAATGD